MVRRDALRLIRRLAAAREVLLTAHAEEETASEGCTVADVLFVLENAEEAIVEDVKRDKWKVYGHALSGTALAVVTLLIDRSRLRVITVHLPP